MGDMHKFGRLWAGALVAVALGSCSSITTGTSQTVTVTTEPPGATCKLQRAGVLIGVVNATPASISIDKSKDHVTVECEKPEHLAGAAVLSSDFQGMTLGNVLIGGIIGIGIDAASGAMHHYPPSVAVILPPEKFASAEDRDAFFNAQKNRISESAASEIAKINQNCAKDDPSQAQCQSRIKAIESSRDADLSRLEAQRMTAKAG
jgi:hypothetical protein